MSLKYFNKNRFDLNISTYSNNKMTYWNFSLNNIDICGNVFKVVLSGFFNLIGSTLSENYFKSKFESKSWKICCERIWCKDLFSFKIDCLKGSILNHECFYFTSQWHLLRMDWNQIDLKYKIVWGHSVVIWTTKELGYYS